MVPSDVPSEGTIYKDVKSPPDLFLVRISTGEWDRAGKGLWNPFFSPVILELKPIFDRHSSRELKWQLYVGRTAWRSFGESGA